MKPTHNQIIDWFYIATEQSKNSIIDFSIDVFTYNPNTYMKRFFIEMKTQIERWDLIMDYLFIHPQNTKLFVSYFGSEVEFFRNDNQLVYETQPVIWGTKIVEVDSVPFDKLLGYYKFEEDKKEGINMVVGNINFNLISRVNNLKAFW